MEACQTRPAELGDGLVGPALEQHAALVQDRHARAQVGDVLDDVGREDHDHLLADLGQQVVEAVALAGVEAGGGLVHDQQLRIADQGLGDAEALAHAAREARQRLPAHVVEVAAPEHGLDTRSRRSPLSAMPLSSAMWSSMSWAEMRG